MLWWDSKLNTPYLSHSSYNVYVLIGKTVPVAYGIKKLQICCVVEDDKVGTDFLEESITAIEDLVSFNFY